MNGMIRDTYPTATGGFPSSVHFNPGLVATENVKFHQGPPKTHAFQKSNKILHKKRFKSFKYMVSRKTKYIFNLTPWFPPRHFWRAYHFEPRLREF